MDGIALPVAPMTAAVTVLLARWRTGDPQALEQLTPLVYRELRRIAGSRLSRERAGHTLQPTALANEAFMRLCGDVPEVDWQSRAHFLGIAGRVMRQVLIQHARAKEAEKRGGGAIAISLDDAGDVASPAAGVDIFGLDAVLTRLAAFDPRKATVVELRYFGGLTVPAIAAELDVSTATIEREMRMALAWLRRELMQ